MSSNVINQTPYLRTSREFPEDLKELTVQITRAYIDTATNINDRTIGLYPTNRPAITGNAYFITNQKQQTIRQLYTFTSTTAIDHGIDPGIGIDPAMFVQCFGSYTASAGTEGYGLIWSTGGGAIPNSISFYLTSTQIVFIVGAGAPALAQGKIVLEWLSAA